MPYGDPTGSRQRLRSGGERPASANACSATSRRARRKARGWCWAAAGPRTSTRGSSSSRRLFADVDPDSTIAQEEIFGPVLSIIPYDDDDDAVRIANNSKYGLSGMIQSGEQRARHGRRPPGSNRHAVGQRRVLVPARRAVRRLQAERHRPRERQGRVRGVPRDQGDRPSRPATEQRGRARRCAPRRSRRVDRAGRGRPRHQRRPSARRRAQGSVVRRRRPARRHRRRAVPALRPVGSRGAPPTRGRCTARRPCTSRCRTPTCRCRACSRSTTRTRRCCRCGSPARTGSRASPTTDERTRTAQRLHHEARRAAPPRSRRSRPARVPAAHDRAPTRYGTSSTSSIASSSSAAASLIPRSCSPSTGCGATSPTYDGPGGARAGRHRPRQLHVRPTGTSSPIVDWELAHLGDPMDDIAWLSLRATQEPLPDFPARLREYASRSRDT